MYRKTLSLLKKRVIERDGIVDENETNVATDPTHGSISFRSTASINAPVSLHPPNSESTISRPGLPARQLPGSQEASLRGTETGIEDPLGLKVLHKPNAGQRADIIFVHGLGGSSRSTWSKNRDARLFWPLQYLAHEPDISEARISTFGYNANFRPGSGKTKVSILDFAKDLLYDLKYAQDESGPVIEDLRMGQNPIVFVVHSMGGLIVKEAYMQGQNDPIYQDIVKAISSIVFLSTPHRGTHLAETLNRILQVSFATSPTQFIAELSGGSQTLQKLNEQFRHVAPKLQIVSFYETRPTPLLKKAQVMVLEKDSSLLGYPGEISKPLDADHHGVCKYDSPEDPKYITVRNALKSLIGKKRSEAGKSEDLLNQPGTGFNFEEYLLVTESSEKDYNFFRDRWLRGTCAWILNHEDFNGWVNDIHQESRLLWIYGNPASGKSILSSFIVDHLARTGLPCSYFFVRFNDLEKRSLSLMLRSIACQLARLSEAFGERLLLLKAASAEFKTASFRNIWQMLFKQSLLQLDIKQPLYIVIDGLDEAEGSGEFIKVLTDLQTTAIPLRVLIVSRRTHDISSAWLKLGRLVHAEVMRMEGSLDDFRSYVNEGMDITRDHSYREQVTTRLLDRANGNFLWIHLAVQQLNGCHTTMAVEEALNNLPAGMESLYDRMAASVQPQPANEGQSLGERILGWAACAQRQLSVKELDDALCQDGMQLIEIRRTIDELCGGFVVVDNDGKVSMVHETARGYLLRAGQVSDSISLIDPKLAHYSLFERCLRCLMLPALRSLISRNKPPALLGYATKFWFIHLSHCQLTEPGILDMVAKFLKGPQVLTWIGITARSRELSILVVASRYLTDVVVRLRRMETGKSLGYHQALRTIDGWATDFVKIVGKFGNSLTLNPDSIHKLIPPFCPESSMIFQQFGRKESKSISVGGCNSKIWDDCLARFSMQEGAVASTVVTGGNRIAILTTIRKESLINIYDSHTFEKQGHITHPERVFSIQLNQLGNLLVTYGYLTTRVWEITNGDCIKVVKNPAKRPRPQTLLFVDEDTRILVGGEDRCIRSFAIEDEDAPWETKAEIDEEHLENTMLNFPMCSALNPDGTMIAFGYRAYPLTVWELEPPMLVGQCSMELDSTDMTFQENTFDEIFRVVWHPFVDVREVFGLTQVGLLFKWCPYEDSPSATAYTAAHHMTVSADGSLIATGDAIGVVKLYATADLSLLYQLSSTDSVISVAFSADARCLHDVRGSHGNVWQPNVLVRMADSYEHTVYGSDSTSDFESFTKLSLQPEHNALRVDNIITLSSQPTGPLYCYGTEEGVAVLCEVERGRVCDLERLSSFLPIEKVTWSQDGKLVAIADISRKLSIKGIAKSGEQRDAWHVDHHFDVKLPPDHGHISQLLFHSSSTQLLASTPTALFSVDMSSRKLKHTELPARIRACWICHPTSPDHFIGFGNSEMYVFAWSTLEEVEAESRVYFPPRLGSRVSTSPFGSPMYESISTKDEREGIGRHVVFEIDSTHILLQLWDSDASSQMTPVYLLFNIEGLSNISGQIEEDSEHSLKELHYTNLPAEVASSIREPLAFLSRRRLMYLDRDRWICTWQLPSTVQRQPSRRPQVRLGGASEIERYYFLPGDWVTADEARLCAVMPDGTLLCPRNGAVATVQAAKLRK